MIDDWWIWVIFGLTYEWQLWMLSRRIKGLEANDETE